MNRPVLAALALVLAGATACTGSTPASTASAPSAPSAPSEQSASSSAADSCAAFRAALDQARPAARATADGITVTGDDRARVDDTVSVLGRERATLEALWGTLPAPTVVYVGSDRELLATWLDDPDADGVTLPLDETGVCVLIAPTVESGQFRKTLVHELTHALLAERPDPPAWLAEGAATYSEARRLDADGRPDPAPFVGRPEYAWDGSITLDDGDEFGSSDDAYTDALLACLYVAREYGEDTLNQLYDAAGTLDEEDAVRKALGIDRAELVRRVESFADDVGA